MYINFKGKFFPSSHVASSTCGAATAGPHAAAVMAQWLDWDATGAPANAAVLQALTSSTNGTNEKGKCSKKCSKLSGSHTEKLVFQW